MNASNWLLFMPVAQLFPGLCSGKDGTVGFTWETSLRFSLFIWKMELPICDHERTKTLERDSISDIIKHYANVRNYPFCLCIFHFPSKAGSK